MKISELAALKPPVAPPPAPAHVAAAAGRRDFQSQLLNLDQNAAMAKLSQMGENIYKQGEIVARRCDILELKRYKEMVSEYMNEAVRLMFEFKKQSTLDARGRHRMYAVIKRVNKKLEELTQELLSGQTDNVKVMDSVDEIRGMLLDMLL